MMMKFRKIVYAENETEMEEAYEEILESYGNKYPKWRSYLENVFEIRQRWCFCYRKSLPLRGNNTNNYVEAQFLVLKDNILNRTKEVKLTQMLKIHSFPSNLKKFISLMKFFI